MSLSGSNSGALRPYTAREMIEEATSRAGIIPTRLTSEVVEKSLDQLNLTFTSLVNRGIQLWKRQKMILPCYQAEANVPLPMGVNLVDKLTRRGLSRVSGGAPFSTNGGTALFAFDDDFATACTQTTPNGSIGMVLPQAQQVTSVGVLFGVAMEVTLFAEWSNDGVTWVALNAVTGVVSKGQWVWFDLDGAPQALQWRVRSVSAISWIADEVFLGYNPSEIPLDPWNLDEYNSMPNKTSPGPVLNYYQQRDVDAPYLIVWPVPNAAAKYDQLVVWVREYLDEVSEPTQALDMPRRWYDAVTAQLARRLCRSLAEADFKRYEMLRGEEQEAIELAEGEERDPAPTNYDMGISAYTS